MQKDKQIIYQLKPQLKRIPNPYPEDPVSQQEHWTHIRFHVIAPTGKKIATVVDIKWDIRPLYEWLEKNKDRLLYEDPPLFVEESKQDSLSKIIENFYRYLDFDDEDNNEICDRMWAYLEAHTLRTPFSGSKLKAIRIGKRNDTHTISRYEYEKDEEGESITPPLLHDWSYPIDLDKFLFEMNKLKPALYPPNTIPSGKI